MRNASIIYITLRSPRRRRAFVGCALALPMILVWWLSATAPSSQRLASSAPNIDQRRQSASEAAGADASAHASATSLPESRVAGHPAPAPYRYVGHWNDKARTTVVLSRGGMNFVVRIPGAIDERFNAESIDERRMTLRDRANGRVLIIALQESPAAVDATTVNASIVQTANAAGVADEAAVPGAAVSDN